MIFGWHCRFGVGIGRGAKQPVGLKALLAQPNGRDEVAYYWSKAMDAKSVQEDGQVVAEVRAVEQARQRAYQFTGQ